MHASENKIFILIAFFIFLIAVYKLSSHFKHEAIGTAWKENLEHFP